MFHRLKLGWSPFIPPFYYSFNEFVRLLLVTLSHWKVTGRENIPGQGALIVVSNHLSNADPGILSVGISRRRRIRYMAKIELYHGIMGALMNLYGAFPVRRFEADVRALLNAERILRDGGAIGMFPEGTRSRSRLLARPHPGTSLIALHSGATLLPCAIVGTEVLENPLRLLRRPPIEVHIGRPIPVQAVRRPTPEQIETLTQSIDSAIRSLLPERYVPAYTDPREGLISPDDPDHPC